MFRRRLLMFSLLLVSGFLFFTERQAATGQLPEQLWSTNYQQALAEAHKTNKQVLLNFTGSDWCPYCIQMDREVLDRSEFKNFALRNLILVKLDYPRRKQLPPDEVAQNKALVEEYRIEGFPTFVLLDSSGKEIRRQVGYLEGGPSQFVKWASITEQ